MASYGDEGFEALPDFSVGYLEEPAPAATGDARAEIAALVPEGVPMLLAILQEQHLIDAPGIRQVLDRQALTGHSLAQILLAEKRIEPDQVLTALQIRANYG